VASSHLGNQTVGFLNSVASGGANSLVAGRQAEASIIVDTAIDQIAVLRGRLGAFERNTLDTTYNSQSIALENLTASESRVRDTDFAKETAELTRSQVLVSAGTSVLALANNTSQSVLQLLQ
jgi:flagellin